VGHIGGDAGDEGVGIMRKAWILALIAVCLSASLWFAITPRRNRRSASKEDPKRMMALNKDKYPFSDKIIPHFGVTSLYGGSIFVIQDHLYMVFTLDRSSNGKLLIYSVKRSTETDDLVKKAYEAAPVKNQTYEIDSTICYRGKIDLTGEKDIWAETYASFRSDDENPFLKIVDTLILKMASDENRLNELPEDLNNRVISSFINPNNIPIQIVKSVNELQE